MPVPQSDDDFARPLFTLVDLMACMLIAMMFGVGFWLIEP